MKDSNPLFGITLWPGVPLPLPAFEHAEYCWDDAQTVLLRDYAGALPVTTPADGEIYLDLLALDLDDGASIAAFANRYSTLGLYQGFPENGWPLLGTDLYVGTRRASAVDALMKARAGNRHTVALLESSVAWFSDSEAVETREEFVLAAQIIRDAARTWLAISQDVLVGEITPESPLALDRLEDANPESRARDSLYPIAFLDEFFSRALRGFRPTLGMARTDGAVPSRSSRTSSGVVPVKGLRYPVKLYEACAAELYNHIAEQAEYKICANETCGRLFVHQEGRSGRKHRDAIYHSRHCAKAQAQRVFRRRKRQEAQVGRGPHAGEG